MNLTFFFKIFLLFFGIFLSLNSYSQNLEFEKTDTIFSKTLDDTLQFSKKKVQRLIKKRKLNITDTVKNSSVYFVNYYNKTSQKVIMLENEKGFLLINVLKDGGNKNSIIDTVDITGDGHNELMIYWVKSFSHDNTFSVGTGYQNGIEIIDLKYKKIVFSMIIKQCHDSYNMCRGKKSVGCNINYKLNFGYKLIEIENIKESKIPIIYKYNYKDGYLLKVRNK